MRKANKIFLKKLENIAGERNAGILIAMLGDSLIKLSSGEQRILRTMEITLNDFFSVKYDFENDEVM